MRLVRRPLPYIPSHTYAQRHTSKTKSKAKASLPGLRRTALRRLQRVGCEVGFWHIAAPDVCDGTSAVGESRHRIPGASVNQLNLA